MCVFVCAFRLCDEPLSTLMHPRSIYGFITQQQRSKHPLTHRNLHLRAAYVYRLRECGCLGGSRGLEGPQNGWPADALLRLFHFITVHDSQSEKNQYLNLSFLPMIVNGFYAQFSKSPDCSIQGKWIKNRLIAIENCEIIILSYQRGLALKY